MLGCSAARDEPSVDLHTGRPGAIDAASRIEQIGNRSTAHALDDGEGRRDERVRAASRRDAAEDAHAAVALRKLVAPGGLTVESLEHFAGVRPTEGHMAGDRIARALQPANGAHLVVRLWRRGQ